MGVLAVLARPYYARNVSEYGTPFVASEYGKVHTVETAQLPGERSWRDYVSFPLVSIVADSRFDSPPLLRSVWASVYLNTWFDTYRASQLARWELVPPNDYPIHRETLILATLGVIPTALAVWGGFGMLRRARRDATARVDTTLAWVAAAGLAFFVAFTLRVPTWAAVKASYLLALALPFGWALSTGIEAALAGGAAARVMGRVGQGAVATSARVTSVVFASDLVYPSQPDQRDIHALRAYFGDFDSARRWLEEPGVREQRHAVEVVAFAEIAAGRPERATELLRSVAGGMVSPEFVNALGVATALSGHTREAIAVLARGVSAGGPAELRINLAAARAIAGDWLGARRDLEHALGRRPDIAIGWLDLAIVQAKLGDGAAAERSASRGRALLQRSPRGFPYGIGDGGLDSAGRGERWLLQLLASGESLRLALYRPGHPPLETGSDLTSFNP